MKKKLVISLIILLLIIIGFLGYARIFGTKGLVVREYKIINSNFTNEYYGMKIIHFSDIHYGNITFKKDLEYMVNKINSLKPDIIIFTGDLIDENTKLDQNMTDELIEVLTKLDSNIGKFAIKGEDDSKFNEFETIIKKANFTYLDNNYDLVYKNTKPILISNINDTKNTTIFDYLNSEDNNSIYNILLIHEPDKIKNIDYKKFNLILAGHSHNGQIKLPLLKPLILEKGSKTYYNDYYKLNDTDFYISGGIGTSKVKLRLNVKPSFNLYRLTNK